MSVIEPRPTASVTLIPRAKRAAERPRIPMDYTDIMARNRPGLRRKKQGNSGDVRPVGRSGDGRQFGMAAAAARDFRHFHISPGAPVGHQRSEHRMIEL